MRIGEYKIKDGKMGSIANHVERHEVLKSIYCYSYLAFLALRLTCALQTDSQSKDPIRTKSTHSK